MALPRIGSELLRIETGTGLTVSIFGSPLELDPRFLSSIDKKPINTTLALHFQGPDVHPSVFILQPPFDGPEAFKKRMLVNDGGGTYSIPNLTPFIFENTDYQIRISAEKDSGIADDILFFHSDPLIRKGVQPISPKIPAKVGSFNFGSDVGFSDFKISFKNVQTSFTLEVFPTKINYKDDYKALVQDISQELYGLITDFLGKTYSGRNLGNSNQQTPSDFFAIIRHIFSLYSRSIEVIVREPYHVLQSEHVVLKGSKEGRIDNDSLRWLSMHPQEVVRSGQRGTFLIHRYLALKKKVTFNVGENEMTKFLLEDTVRILQHFRILYLHGRLQDDDNLDPTLCDLNGMISSLTRVIHGPFFSSIDAAFHDVTCSSVFTMSPGYRDFYRYNVMLRKALNIQGGPYNLQLKDLSVLYEYWCFIKLNKMVRDNPNYRYDGGNLIRLKNNGLYVCMAYEKSHVKYVNVHQDGLSVTLLYNHTYRASETATVDQRPDNVLKIIKEGEKHPAFSYVFDAKYRLGANLDWSQGSMPEPPVDTINDMHHYRDAIVYSDGNFGHFSKRMFGAFVLFPYDDSLGTWKTDRFFKSIEKVNIGALPFLPSQTAYVGNCLNELLGESTEMALDRTIPAANAEVMEDCWSIRNVVVVPANTEDQLDAFVNKKMFWIPADRLSSPVRYVALYQSKCVFDADPCIWWYGEIKEVTNCSGEELHKRWPSFILESEQRFWLFSFDTIKRLSNAITDEEGLYEQSMGKVSKYPLTNFVLLRNAKHYFELTISTDAERRLLRKMERLSWANPNAQGFVYSFGGASIRKDSNGVGAFVRDKSNLKKILNLTNNCIEEQPGQSFEDLVAAISQFLK